ncbi:MAG: HNH endonuclease [Lactobacillus sp.]|nr:HNH endonuclease [Lactobacillus sp.]
MLDRDNHLDQYAFKAGLIVQATTVDHIVPIEVAPELRDDPDNLIACTSRTNRIKTQWEQDYYGTGAANRLTGAPWIRKAADLPINFDPPAPLRE